MDDLELSLSVFCISMLDHIKNLYSYYIFMTRFSFNDPTTTRINGSYSTHESYVDQCIYNVFLGMGKFTNMKISLKKEDI